MRYLTRQFLDGVLDDHYCTPNATDLEGVVREVEALTGWFPDDFERGCIWVYECDDAGMRHVYTVGAQLPPPVDHVN